MDWKRLGSALVLTGAFAVLAAPGAAANPRGYTLVSSGDIVAFAGMQGFGSVTCPAGLVPLGGSVGIHSVNLSATVSSSFPVTSGWTGSINNLGASPITFEIDAACARQPKRYAVLEGPFVQNPTGSEAEAVVSCPSGAKPLSGGVSASSDSLDVSIYTSVPAGRAWQAVENNSGPGANAISAFAVCARIPGYVVVQGAPAVNGAGSHTLTFASCPDLTVATGGGPLSDAMSLAVSAGGMGLNSSDFVSSMNNGSDIDATSSTVAVCA
jgi:hypothetical protein